MSLNRLESQIPVVRSSIRQKWRKTFIRLAKSKRVWAFLAIMYFLIIIFCLLTFSRIEANNESSVLPGIFTQEQENSAKLRSYRHFAILSVTTDFPYETPASFNELLNLKIPVMKRASPIFNEHRNSRQQAVVDSFLHAWKGYKNHAWGKDELMPVSNSSQTVFDLGLTIVDSLDTAIIMGLEHETREAIDWIKNSLSFENDRFINVFECTIRILGGLLSSYHLTGEKVLLEKAQTLGDRLLPAFTKSKSKVPFSDINLKTGVASSPNAGFSSLAEATSLQMEFRDLSRSTGNGSFEKIAFATSIFIHEHECGEYEGLCPYFISANGDITKTTITMGARADSYYEYLFKQWLQTGKSIDWLLEDFKKTINSTKKYLYRRTSPNGYWIIGEILNDKQSSFYPKMDHLACFLAGTLALSHANNVSSQHLEMAEELGETCHEMYKNPTGLGPEIIHGNLKRSKDESYNDIYIKNADSHSLLRPEAIEAWFYLFRVTGNKKYQEWGWEAFQAIEKYAKIESGGYSSIKSVLNANSIQRIDKMESFFIAETLKYLYLLLADDQTILPLDRWVFNTEAHPLPIYAS